MNYKDFYKGKKILITGTTGFKGAWLAFWLNSIGAEVVGYSLKPETKPSLFDVLNIDKKIQQIYGDIRDISHLDSIIKDFQPEIVFHLAAQPLVRESYRSPIYTFETNIMGTINILDSIRRSTSIKGGIIITTDKVYENKESMVPYKESDKLGGHDPYSSSKAMCEIAVESYNKSFLSEQGKKVVSVRAGNVIGGGDWSYERLIPDIINSIYNGDKLIIRNPESVRPWQYVLEALHGYLIMGMKIFEDDSFLGAYNFGPDEHDNLKVIDIVKKSIELLESGEYEIQKDINLHEAGLLLLDNSRAKKLLGWNPKYNINEVLERTLNWYKSYHDGADIEKLSLEEIQNFNI